MSEPVSTFGPDPLERWLRAHASWPYTEMVWGPGVRGRPLRIEWPYAGFELCLDTPHGDAVASHLSILGGERLLPRPREVMQAGAPFDVVDTGNETHSWVYRPVGWPVSSCSAGSSGFGMVIRDHYATTLTSLPFFAMRDDCERAVAALLEHLEVPPWPTPTP